MATDVRKGGSSSAVCLHRLPSARPKDLTAAVLPIRVSRKTLLRISLTVHTNALYSGMRLENMTSAICRGTNSSL